MEDLARRRRPRRYESDKVKREYAVLAGFDPSTRVITDDGPTPLEWLNEGDRVMTHGGGFEPVLWIDRTRLQMGKLRSIPELAPVLIEAGALGDNRPERAIVVSPSQLMYLPRDPRRPDGEGALVPASAIGTRIDPSSRPAKEVVTYLSVLLPAHHLISVDGVVAGSLFLADLALSFDAEDPVLKALRDDVMEPVVPIISRQDVPWFLQSRAMKAAGLTA